MTLSVARMQIPSTHPQTRAQIVGLKCNFIALSNVLISSAPTTPPHYRENIEAVALPIEVLGVEVGWGGGGVGVEWGRIFIYGGYSPSKEPSMCHNLRKHSLSIGRMSPT